jgi:serine/threonine-protein kinase
MTDSEQIDEFLLRWDELREQGTPPSVEALCRDCPELREEVSRRIAVLEAMYRVPNGSAIRAETLQLSPRPSATGTALPHLEGYEVLEVLGTGGMGKVYKARHVGLNRYCAVKMILAGAHATPEEAERFRVEAEAIARMQHPNIVQIYEIGVAGSCPFLVLEYLEGGSLERRLQGRPIPPRQAAETVRSLAAAMHDAHRHDIVHRDLKPANILLSADGIPKIADFGLAKLLGAEPGLLGRGGLTQTGSVLGSPNYMAPEQAEGRTSRIGPATDVYALGAILYECLTGKPPFEAPNLLETLEKVRGEEPARPRQDHPEIPADLETICLKCLQKEPSERYASAKDLADDLQRFLDGEPIRVRAPSLIDMLKSALNRTRELPDLSRSARILRVLDSILLLISGTTILTTYGKPVYPWACLLAVLFTIPVLVSIYFVYTGEGLRVPLNAVTRHLWSVRFGMVQGLLLLPVVSWWVHPDGAEWNPLTVFPLWCILIGVTFFGMGVYWGRLYLLGLAFLGVALLMPLRLEWAPIAFAGMLGTSLWLITRHIQRMGEARASGNVSERETARHVRASG